MVLSDRINSVWCVTTRLTPLQWLEQLATKKKRQSDREKLPLKMGVRSGSLLHCELLRNYKRTNNTEKFFNN